MLCLKPAQHCRSALKQKRRPSLSFVKNPPASAENVRLLSGLGRLHTLRAATTGPASPERMRCSREAAATRSSPAPSTRGKPASSSEGPGQPKGNERSSSEKIPHILCFGASPLPHQFYPLLPSIGIFVMAFLLTFHFSSFLSIIHLALHDHIIHLLKVL